ncbi:hypothetical protein ASPFODRAFT_694083 [Aspergillus luchuensis CBS 106.47]|uniref:Uncharacterized protein n=1 Tax=Aspergillus luchuensis (strain CBS 106.47) TaxID=1137211 RepID=A0A1M3TDI6_ASPLC|nr:hypothetical protein ASPFODRAFT_694083 [Aspergillus luchuensis CBS 106.47]
MNVQLVHKDPPVSRWQMMGVDHDGQQKSNGPHEPGDLPRKVTEGPLHSLVGGNYLVDQLVSRCESADARMGTAVSHRFIVADHSQFSFLDPLPSLHELLTPGLSDDDH